MEYVTEKGLELKDLGVGDIVTVSSSRIEDRSYSDVIFEVQAVTAAACVLKVRWSGLKLYKPGEQRVMRRAEWRFYEASDLLEAVEG